MKLDHKNEDIKKVGNYNATRYLVDQFQQFVLLYHAVLGLLVHELGFQSRV